MSIFTSFLRKKYKTIPHDDFIRRLRCSVIGEGMLNEGNIQQIEFAIQNITSHGSVLEIGSYGGLSTNLICYFLRKHDKKNAFFTCDAWVYEGYKDHKGSKSEYIDGRNDVKRVEYMNYIKQSFINSTKLLSATNLPFSIHLPSDTFFKKWMNNEIINDVYDRSVTLGGPICFAYIDGDHSHEVAMRDFENVVLNLVDGGYILLDDSSDNLSFGSAQLVKKIKSDSRFEIISANPNYLIRKKSK